MSLTSRSCVVVVASLIALSPSLSRAASAPSQKGARVTQIIRDVKLLPNEADPRPAAVNDSVSEDTAVRTGDKSRSELTFADMTISRLGANSVFSFNKAGHSVDLGSGSILLRVPKDSGGGSIKSSAVSVAVTGTTLILEATRAGRSKLIVLEGAARLRLNKYPSQSRNVLAGQMLDVPAGATTLPEPTNIDLNQVMNSHPLITSFPPLPSRGLIAAAADQQRNGGNEPVYQGQPVTGGGGGRGTVGLPGLILPPGLFGGSGSQNNPNGAPPTRGGGRKRPQTSSQSNAQKDPNSPTGR